MPPHRGSRRPDADASTAALEPTHLGSACSFPLAPTWPYDCGDRADQRPHTDIHGDGAPFGDRRRAVTGGQIAHSDKGRALYQPQRWAGLPHFRSSGDHRRATAPVGVAPAQRSGGDRGCSRSGSLLRRRRARHRGDRSVHPGGTAWFHAPGPPALNGGMVLEGASPPLTG